MRRNLRLDWRALALLGALLSIIIDWPGLVYAMPTILPAVTAPKADTLNIIKNDKNLNFVPYDHDPAHVAYSVKDEFTTQTTMENSPSLQTQRTIRDNPRLTLDVQSTETEMPQQRSLTTHKNLNSISHSHHRDDTVTGVDTAMQQNSHETQLAADANVSPTNTHIMDANASAIANASAATSTPTPMPISMLTPTTTPTPMSMSMPTSDIKFNSSSAFITTTESSGKIQSTLTPTTTIDDGFDEAEDKAAAVPSGFQFSSSHHLAILSRTERSIRSSASTVNTKKLEGPAARGGGGGGGMVRRSSDVSGGTKTKRLNNSRNLHNRNNLDRNERSTVSYLSGPSRKIQLYIKNRFLQLMPDGTVNGTQDDLSEYTILQRSTVDVGRIKIQGVATCLYLCMDACGSVYGSKDFTDDCVFNENMEQHNYNTYSSTYNSNARRKYFLALNRHGEPRKLQIPPSRSLGKLSTYTNAITETVPQERVEQLIAKNFGANRIKHGIRQLCDTGKPLIELIDSINFKARPKCNPNNSNSISNSNSVSNSNSHSHSNSRKNLNSLNSVGHSNSGQLLNNVPAANDNSKLSNSPSLSSSSSSSSGTSGSSSSSKSTSSSTPATNSSSTSHNGSSGSGGSGGSGSSSSRSSISISQNNGHISDSNSSSTTTRNTAASPNSGGGGSNSPPVRAGGPNHGGDRGKKKQRKCRPSENEEEHNCQRRPQPLRNPGGGGGGAAGGGGGGGGGPKLRRCRELFLQQQQAGVTDIVLPPMCNKKGGLRRQTGKNKRLGEARGKNGLGTDGLGPNNRRGKKLNVNAGRQAAKNGGNNNNTANAANGGGPKKRPKNPKRNGGGGNNNNKKKPQRTTSTTSTTTVSSIVTSTSGSSSTSTQRSRLWESSSYAPSSQLYDKYDPHAESTSDRGDREQRNVRYSMEESGENSAEDTSAANEEQEDDDADGEAADVEHNADAFDDNEEASYEDDADVMSSSHMPYVEATADGSQTPLTSGSDDFLYYDQLDL